MNDALDCPITISVIADKVVISIKDGDRQLTCKMDQRTGHHVNCAIATALHTIASGRSVARSLDDFLTGLSIQTI
jgi:tRNA threonylcarbamoyladenosine modification (KEOPS) complex Cgi121 subunit